MKRLIVLTALITLLALLSGCSILGPRQAQTCHAPASEPARANGIRLPRLRLPWTRPDVDVRPAIGRPYCPSCQEGIIEGSITPGRYETGSYDTTPIDGQLVDGLVESSDLLATATYGSESLYHPEEVGPAYSEPTYESIVTPNGSRDVNTVDVSH